ncbi:YceD family protein [Pseudactinotalea terrae]|uniref:YceD family protein n=1 Tax=Pseudactinotalea terrae TaxID=1743262 RepID=UPI0012E19167|nr:YceD family protein [Pseudactinotalea terrae]
MTTSPFVINIHDLSRRPGSMRELDVSVTLAEPLGSDVIAIAAGASLDLQLRLESVSEGVLVTGTATGTATGECVRCLRELSEEVDVDITELFAYEDTRSRRTADEGEDPEPLPVLDGDLLDLETTVTDAVVTSLPFQPVCTPDCAGLCSECGVRLDDAEPGHSHEILDPRWAALSELARGGDGDDAEGEGEEPR